MSCRTLCFAYSLRMAIFLNTDISQGSVATRLGCGGVFIYHLVTNLPLSLTVKELWKSVNIWWSYGQEIGVLFFDSRCIMPSVSACRNSACRNNACRNTACRNSAMYPCTAAADSSYNRYRTRDLDCRPGRPPCSLKVAFIQWTAGFPAITPAAGE